MEIGDERTAPMTLTTDEQRALAFIAALLLVSAAVRIAALPDPVGPPDGAGLDLDAHIAATEKAVAAEERRRRPLADGERLDPNRAPASELERIPGVGPALAGRIARSRTEDGPFRGLSDLRRVSGVGERTAERLAPYLDLGPPVRAGGGGRDEVVDVNRADADGLARLPGVGPVLAARIIAHRDAAGPFLAVDSLLAVPGIGPATLERLRPLVRVRP